VTDGKPIAVWSQAVSGVSAISLLVAFYDIQGRKGPLPFFAIYSSVPDLTRDKKTFFVLFAYLKFQ
jgi:hypothetical protein